MKRDGTRADDWRYPHGSEPGEVSEVVFLDFEPGAKVYLLIGSRAGGTGDVVVRESRLPRC